MLIIGAALLFRITTADGLIAFYDNGHGPLAALPLPAQMVIFLIGEDIILYWTHRLFHGQRMWRYHAVHHSSEELEWISAARFHPVELFLGNVAADVIMLLIGISPNVLRRARAVDHRAFGLRACQSRLDARTVQICDRRTRFSIAGITPRPIAAAKRTLPRRSRSSMCYSARSTCRKANFPTITASPSATFRRASRPRSCTRSRNRRQGRAAAVVPFIVKQASPALPLQARVRPARFALHSRICSQVELAVRYGLFSCRIRVAFRSVSMTAFCVRGLAASLRRCLARGRLIVFARARPPALCR